MADEASNISRRLIAALETIEEYRPLHRDEKRAARTLRPEDLRSAGARSYSIDRYASPRSIIVRSSDPIPGRPRQIAAYRELRGLAKSVRKYGGPEKVRADADPVLIAKLTEIGWRQA